MQKKNDSKRKATIMADQELGIGKGHTEEIALKHAFEYALHRWCRHPEQRAQFLETYTCIEPTTQGVFPPPRYRKRGEAWSYPGQQTLFHKYCPEEDQHQVVIQMRMPKPDNGFTTS